MTPLTEELAWDLKELTPIHRREIKKVRHKAERFLYVLCVIITVSAILFAFAVIPDENESPAEDGGWNLTETGTDFFTWLFEDEDVHEDDAAEDNPYELLYWALGIPVIIFFLLHYHHAQTRAYAIRVSEKNFPEIYRKSIEYAKKLGLKKVPAVYIEQQHGILNAFAAAIIGKRYIMLNAELVDVAYMEHKDFDTVFFVLAHEFGHVYFKHVTFLTNILVFIPHLIPVFGQLHSRAMEYSCDRVAQLLLERNCVHEAMVLSAGRHLYKHVDAEDYLANAKKEKGIFIWFVNLMATHPITPKRIAALADSNKRSGKLL